MTDLNPPATQNSIPPSVLSKIYMNENDDDVKIKCDSCDLLDDFDHDVLVICSTCNVAIH